jgi:nicotinamide mononucleotide transporter
VTAPELVASALQAAQAMNPLEVIAVLLGIAYLLLAIRESLWCWYAAFGSTALFLYLFWHVDLIMESALQVYYLGMALYGWWQWQQGTDGGRELKISRWQFHQHLWALGSVMALSAISGMALMRWTDAALPFLDSFTTWGSIITTWMVARKILENWLYWLAIDSVSIYLYLDRGLHLTALLFAAYLIIALAGYRQWSTHYRSQSS